MPDATPRVFGTVRDWPAGKRFGFIRVDHRLAFVHSDDVEGGGPLAPGEQVSLELTAGSNQRPKAIHVKRLGATRAKA